MLSQFETFVIFMKTLLLRSDTIIWVLVSCMRDNAHIVGDGYYILKLKHKKANKVIAFANCHLGKESNLQFM